MSTIAAARVRHVVLLSSSAVTFPGAETDFKRCPLPPGGARGRRGRASSYTFLRPGGVREQRGPVELGYPARRSRAAAPSGSRAGPRP